MGFFMKLCTHMLMAFLDCIFEILVSFFVHMCFAFYGICIYLHNIIKRYLHPLYSFADEIHCLFLLRQASCAR